MNPENKEPTTYFAPEQLAEVTDSRGQSIYQLFQEKVTDPEYPCVGAKAAVNSNQFRIGLYGEMGTAQTTQALAQDLKKYITETLEADSEYMTMLAVFTDAPQDELQFEQKLWQQLQALHDSEKQTQTWAPEVSDNPADENFSFSFNGTSFFIVGLHPQASRKARRMEFTAMAFNLHRQFEQLREKGVYDNMKKVIRERDMAYDGSINPMLSDFGDGLEAPQYSGRQVDDSWKCPFLAGK
ncbi:guanitoxin biosynthesis heme-dependent pre-guanitoxin N-hydroxylase GntA [Rufibacter roseus]|uniref:Guanitoxin biosynthesis heme-dependent pre-guanitoxin N-hydroxylase GntA n=1 Tax=Rufibacter roseus TaxID=1567108 RepID=A0ABW2DJF2_9BACT|nr:guanitoxin biosynthesis heme-dependent pre-guanitoxin N-hydroxylase GntA [Rufibacter roseus]